MKNIPLLARMALRSGFTPGERKLADMFERESSQLAFLNLAEVSAKAGVGKTTVTRFLRKLGYANFPAFTRSMRSEARDILESPSNVYERDRESRTDSPVSGIGLHLVNTARGMERAATLNTPEQLEAALHLLTDMRRPLYIMGGATAYALSYYAYILMRYVRRRVFLLDADVSTLAHKLSDLDERAVLLAISFHRFSRITKNVMKLFHERGNKVVYLTDRHANPLMPYADIHLVAPTEGGEHTVFSSRATAMALIEGLVAAMSPPLEAETRQRLDFMEKVFTEIGAFE